MYTLKIFLAIVAGSAELAVYANDFPESPQNRTSDQRAQNPPQQLQQNSGQLRSLNQLPQPVQKTITQHAGGADLKTIYQITRNGQPCYTATFGRERMTGQVTVAQDGSLLSLQESRGFAVGVELPGSGRDKIAFDQLPHIVQRAIKSQAGGAEIGDLSHAEINGKAVYRAEFNREGIHHELFISPSGNIAAQVQETAFAGAPMENRRALSLDATPVSVQRSVRKHARSGIVTDVHQANLNGETVYSIMLDNHGRLSQYIFDQNGIVLSEPGRPISEAAGAPNHSNEPDTEQHNHRILQHPK
ncbi:MAG: hypothetical protein ACXWBP_08655 [Limisphaerales bacterium]